MIVRLAVGNLTAFVYDSVMHASSSRGFLHDRLDVVVEVEFSSNSISRYLAVLNLGI